MCFPSSADMAEGAPTPLAMPLPRASSDELMCLASDASTFSISRSGSSVSRSDSLWLVNEWPAVDDEVVASGKQQLRTFDLDATTLSTDVICHLALEIFASAGLLAGLAEDCVRRFVLAVRASMLDNPYHNFYHVFDVMQTTNALATATGTMARLTPGSASPSCLQPSAITWSIRG